MIRQRVEKKRWTTPHTHQGGPLIYYILGMTEKKFLTFEGGGGAGESFLHFPPSYSTLVPNPPVMTCHMCSRVSHVMIDDAYKESAKSHVLRSIM